jgi:hypothetical protein
MKPWLFGLLLLACSHATPPTTTAAAAAPASPATPAAPAGPDPVAAFETVRTVLQSPRCVNCHPTGDIPLQGDDSHLHQPLIKRGPEGRGVAGISCATCHGKQNLPASYGAHTPPGVSTEWRLPPADHRLVFWGLDSKALCEQIKDPKRNGGKGLAELTHHVTEDALTLWGWAPGFGRKPVQVSHEEFVRAFKTWADAGMPCAQRTATNP